MSADPPVFYRVTGERGRERLAVHCGLAGLTALDKHLAEYRAAGWRMTVEACPRGEPPIRLNASLPLHAQAVEFAEGAGVTPVRLLPPPKRSPNGA